MKEYKREVHEILLRKKKQKNETYIDYLFDMIKIGDSVFDDKAMIRHVVNGENVTPPTRHKMALTRPKGIRTTTRRKQVNPVGTITRK